MDSRLRGNDEVEVTRNLKQAKPNEPDSHFRGNDGILGFCFCRNDEILSFRNLSEKTETAPPSFPRRRESRAVGTETYQVKRFL
ncbi:pilus assembly protein PilS [Neisseria gonorrhoeae]|nr:pilus assembly protein PilS [Neisseria gonorrhoeae]